MDDARERRESITVQRGEAGLDTGGRRTLLVLGSGLPVSYPLGTQGRVTIGRASDNLVEIDEPAVSRHHVVLHLGREVVLEDLGSSNGTRVGGKKLDPGAKVQLAPGVPVELGTAMLLVQDRAVARSPRRLWTWDYFEARLEEECRRAQRLASRFAILHVRSSGPAAVTAVERRLGALLPRLDVVARYVPGEYEILLVGADLEEALATGRSVAAGLGDPHVVTRIGHAVYPDDGRTPDELVAAAALRAEEDAPDDTLAPSGPIAVSAPMRELLRTIERIAADAIPVLVVGETGTGKELVADEIHRRSGRGAGPLVRIDGSSSRADTALEPDADGHHELLQERGGTIVIDEICELSPANQARLARLLEAAERAAESTTDLPRFVATTNRDLEAEVAAGRFRIDLYHRLDGVTLVVPPLRQRIDDIEPLARRFAEESAARLGRGEAPTFSEVALARLQTYRWPGNVRELKNVVRRAVLLADGPVILPPHLPLEKLAAAFAPDEDDDDEGGLSQVREQFQAVERQRIELALQRAGGNQTEAAKLLGIARRTLIKRLDQYDLPRPRKQK